jgi:Transport and Golgi organisation 2
MCTAIVSVGPGQILLAGIRDELTDRAWRPPARHWPEYPGLTGGLDLLAGGTWLAVADSDARVACVLNGRGQLAPAAARRSRGVLPLLAAAEGKLARDGLAAFDPFHLLTAEPGRVSLASWDGERLTERELPAGLHMIVNSGLASDLLGACGPTGQRPPAREHELARITYFLPRLQAAVPPQPRPGVPVADAWGGWLPLLNGDGLATGDPRALIVRRDLGDGRTYGSTSVSLVALSAQGLRYDFTGQPGDPGAWQPVRLEPTGAR